MKLASQLLNLREIKLLINSLRNAAFTRDYKKTRELFKPIWNIEESPNFAIFESPEQAQLYKLAGSFLVNFGKAKNLPNYQERGKNALTKAIELFWRLDNTEEAMECQMMLAIGYHQEGSIEEYQALLEDAENYFQNNKIHSVYLLIQINYLIIEIARREIRPALLRIERLSLFVEVSPDVRIKTLYFTQTGIVQRLSGNYGKSLESFNSALTYARACENIHYQALITNCVANTHRSLKNFAEARSAIQTALQLARRDEGWTAHFLDTEANIYLDQGDYENAAASAEAAVRYFRKGEDAGGLIEALWTQMMVHFKLDLREIAFKIFFELYALCSQQSGGKMANKYLLDFLDLVYVDTGADTFDERIMLYKKFLVQNALLRADGKIVEAAKILGINSHQTLSAMIRKHFPEVLDDFQIKRKSRSDRAQK